MKTLHIFRTMASAMLIAVATNAQSQQTPTVYSPGMTLCAFSDNAAYAVSATAGEEDVDNPRAVGGTLLDLKTHETTTIGAPSGWAVVSDVADDGTVVGSAAGKPGYWTPATQEWTTYDVPKEWGGGCFMAVTPDAHYAVGYYFDATNEYIVYPMYYDLTTGESIALPNLPKEDMTGVDQHQNLFYGISPDGRYILGQMSQSYLMPVALFSYVYDTVNDTWKPIGYNYDAATKKFTPLAGNLHFVDTQYQSCNGEWVTGTAYVVYGGGEANGGSEGYCPYRYNLLTDNFELFEGTEDIDVAGEKITADGVVLASSPKGNPYPTALIRSGNYFISLDQIIQQVYGMEVSDLIHDYVTGSFQAISADGLTAVMTTYDNCYIITMPESFVDLASQVDLLAQYSVNVPDGSTMSRISELQITFERPIECLNLPKNIQLLDGNGNLVRNASGISISPTNDHTVVIAFRSTNLNPEETYTVDIPAEMIWLKGDTSIKSKAIQLHYTGRHEGPIQIVEVNPADGSAIAQFNANPDYLAVTFDTPIALSKEASCILYNADSNNAIALFGATAAGNQAIFYPLADCQLYKGSNYRLVISAGSVTDLSGAGGCEEIILEYKGSYLRELSEDDIYIFNSSCDNYDKFMYWQGESNTPAAIPTSWGFLPENPWLLVRENENSQDWALAAHSMFTPPGESDDWLCTPQLFIPDANAYLAFDAQSYLHIKKDKLEVYILATDEVFNYFDESWQDRFITEGDLVFDETLSAGKSDEQLSDDWTHYTIALDKYAGQNIYIAFANRNYDQSAIFLDDIQVIRNITFVLTNQTPTAVISAGSVNVSGALSLGSEIGTSEGLTLRLINAEGELVDEIKDETAVLNFTEPYIFSFSKPLTTVIGQENKYEIGVESGEFNSSYIFTVKDLSFATNKKVILEEYTGAACGNCPLGILAIENLENLYPDNFIPVALRTYMNDIYAGGITDYTSFLELNAAPSGRINRGEILSPMMQNGASGYTFYGRGIVTSDSSEAYLWADAVQDELNVPADAEISFSANYNQDNGNISIPCQVRFAIDRKDASVGVFAVIIENQLPTYQLNYFNSVKDPILGDWGQGGAYAQQTVTGWQASDVARFVVNGTAFTGTNLTESDFIAGETYHIELDANIPTGRLSNYTNCEAVVMLIDKTTGHIINADKCKLGEAGIENIENDDTTVTYYNLQGVKIENPQSGNIYIRIHGNKADKVRL